MSFIAELKHRNVFLVALAYMKTLLPMSKSFLQITLALVGVAPILVFSEPPYPPVDTSANAEVVITDEEWAEIMDGVRNKLPADLVNTDPLETEVFHEASGARHVTMAFERQSVSPHRTQQAVGNCYFSTCPSQWRCSVIVRVRQSLSWQPEPVLVAAQIDEATVNLAADHIRQFVAKYATTSKPEILIIHMMGFGVEQSEQRGTAYPIQARVKLDGNDIRIDVIPKSETSTQPAITRFGCFIDPDPESSNRCDVIGNPRLQAYRQAAFEAYHKMYFSRAEFDVLMAALEPQLSTPALLSYADPPGVWDRDGTKRAVVSFQELAVTEDRSLGGWAQCKMDQGVDEWQCEVRELIKLRIPGQDNPLSFWNSLTDNQALGMIAYLREYLTVHPDLNLKPDQVSYLSIQEDMELVDEVMRFKGEYFVIAKILNGGEIYITIDPIEFQQGRLAVSDITLK